MRYSFRVLVTLSFASLLVHAATIVDQSNLPNLGGYYGASKASSTFDQWVGQTITAGATGRLVRVDLALWRVDTYNPGARLRIYDFNLNLLGNIAIPDGSIGLGQVDAFGQISIPNASNQLPVSLDLSALNIQIAAGQRYLLWLLADNLCSDCVVRTPSGGSQGFTKFAWASSNSDTYSGGNAGFAFGTPTNTLTGSNDLGFRTFVEQSQVPEPATISIAFFTLMAMGASRCRKS